MNDFRTPKMQPESQDWQDDLETWGDYDAMVNIIDEDDEVVTDFILTPEQVRVMFTALRDHAKSKEEAS